MALLDRDAPDAGRRRRIAFVKRNWPVWDKIRHKQGSTMRSGSKTGTAPLLAAAAIATPFIKADNTTQCAPELAPQDSGWGTAGPVLPNQLCPGRVTPEMSPMRKSCQRVSDIMVGEVFERQR